MEANKPIRGIIIRVTAEEEELVKLYRMIRIGWYKDNALGYIQRLLDLEAEEKQAKKVILFHTLRR